MWGSYYMNRFKTPAEGFVFVSQRGDAPPGPPSSRLRGPLLGFGKGLCIQPAAG